jgi:hypothetical protein
MVGPIILYSSPVNTIHLEITLANNLMFKAPPPPLVLLRHVLLSILLAALLATVVEILLPVPAAVPTKFAVATNALTASLPTRSTVDLTTSALLATATLLFPLVPLANNVTPRLISATAPLALLQVLVLLVRALLVPSPTDAADISIAATTVLAAKPALLVLA